ncbi:substrate-binding domain-containing protein [Neptunitalea lumnitzerae]|uniref:ABC transporter substrate-binding protein n=1 Tax=Neptunitalea lumnitzerae TaxID=2965509 RepID=A0ABQ5MIQ2_9FLAO|nr:substrate-binding domain-containing protein [Neptunitalea sp. Y10]GLB49255.1 ABC transporter substrate-binding protein [Neptunitalea sp. Y10]
MKKVTIAGVPEHFNLPWHLAIEDGAFENRGIDLEFTEVPEGTGKMCQMLRNNETDLAIILTEGIVKDIAAGNTSKIVQGYVDSPLLWGIHVAYNSTYSSIEDLKGTKAAISRFGSGSHLMAYVNASNQHWNLQQDLNFEVVNTLDGAIEALTNDTAQYFMWERFTTKPVVDKGIFRRITDCPTPWPCFVIAASEEFITTNAAILKHILEVINTYTEEFKIIPSIDRTIANRYGIQLEDVQDWLPITRWGQQQLSDTTITKVIEQLTALNLLENNVSSTDILWR